MSPAKAQQLISPLNSEFAITQDAMLTSVNYDFDLSDISAENSQADDVWVLEHYIYNICFKILEYSLWLNENCYCFVFYIKGIKEIPKHWNGLS